MKKDKKLKTTNIISKIRNGEPRGDGNYNSRKGDADYIIEHLSEFVILESMTEKEFLDAYDVKTIDDQIATTWGRSAYENENIVYYVDINRMYIRQIQCS